MIGEYDICGYRDEEKDEICSLRDGHSGGHFLVPQSVMDDMLQTLQEEDS